MGVEPASVRASTLSDMNIIAASKPIAIKFYLKHHWGGGKAALGLGQIRSELRVPWQQIAPIGLQWGKQSLHFFSAVFHPIFSYLQVTMACMRAQRCSKFGMMQPLTAELAALESMKQVAQRATMLT